MISILLVVHIVADGSMYLPECKIAHETNCDAETHAGFSLGF